MVSAAAWIVLCLGLSGSMPIPSRLAGQGPDRAGPIGLPAEANTPGTTKAPTRPGPGLATEGMAFELARPLA